MPRGRPKKTTDKSLPKAKEVKAPVQKKRGRKPKYAVPPINAQDGPLTKEQMEDRKEAIRATLPKFDMDRARDIYDLAKDKEMCKVYTSFSCHRPDIYLDLGCVECVLQKNCACPIKDTNRKPDGKSPKFRKFTSAKKSS